MLYNKKWDEKKKLVRYDRRVFWKWLNAQPDGAIVGVNCDSRNCPLTRCFGQGADERGYDLPGWADNLMLRIDCMTPHSHMPVTKEDCLKAWRKTFRSRVWRKVQGVRR